MPSHQESFGFATNCIHAGQEPDPNTGAVIPPISLSTTFKQSSVGKHKGYEYSRSGNPTRHNLETAIAALEGAKYGLAFSSGSATTASIVNMFPKCHIVSVNDVYGGTYRYFNKVAVPNGHKVTFVELSDPANIKSVLTSETKLVWIETPTNPTLRLVDIGRVVSFVRAFDPSICVVVDNTFLSSYYQKPLSLGADIVVHSCTKYLNGHSDAVMGIAVTSSTSFYDRLKFLQNSIGAVPSPFDCYLVQRGLKTLHVRMERHGRNAMAIATFLESLQPSMVERVIYPGLPSHPQHALAKSQQTGFGGMISFVLRGTLETSNRFLQNLKIFALAESLGGIESLAELPCLMTHASISPEDRLKLGISDTLVRLSVGIEEVQDLIDDIMQAIKSAQ